MGGEEGEERREGCAGGVRDEVKHGFRCCTLVTLSNMLTEVWPCSFAKSRAHFPSCQDGYEGGEWRRRSRSKERKSSTVPLP